MPVPTLTAFRQDFRRLVSIALIAQLLAGCYHGQEPKISYVGKRDLNAEYYKDVATEIAFPILDVESEHDEHFGSKPRTLRDRPEDQAIWDMTLAEAIHLSLINNKILRVGTDFPSQTRNFATTSSARVLSQPDFVPSVFDPAIQDSGVLFGGRGVEAALSAFDAQFNNTMTWGRQEQVQNNLFFGGGLNPGATLTNETAQFQSQLGKPLRTGGSFAVSQVVNYSLNNAPFNLFPSSYNGFVRADFRQPLLAGSGYDYVAIAGPPGQGIQGISGVNQGVSIARINNDITIADFELNVTNMLFDTEKAFWDLYLAYRRYDAAVTSRNSALRTWREVKARTDTGARGGGAANEAQAREAYFARRALEEVLLNDIDLKEVALRRLCGLPVNDGRVIRPADEPITAELIPDWHISLAEALTRRVELRRQKWQVKSLDLQLSAARSLVRPRLDFVSSYAVNGFGDKLLSYNDDDNISRQGLNSYYETITQGNQTGWTLGAEFSMPIGFRAALSQVRNIELRLAKSREILAVQEEEITYELAKSFQDLDLTWVNAETNFNRRRAAERQVQAFDAEYRVGTKTLDLLLQAQARLADAENEYFTSIVEYSKSIAHVNYRKGTLLEMNNVHLQEGQWDPMAYQEALKRAWARTYAWDVDRVKHDPPAFAIPGNIGSTGFPADPNQPIENVPVMDDHQPYAPATEVPAPADEMPLDAAPEGIGTEGPAAVPYDPAPDTVESSGEPFGESPRLPAGEDFGNTQETFDSFDSDSEFESGSE